MGQNRHGVALASLYARQLLRPRRIMATEQDGGFGESPLEVGMAEGRLRAEIAAHLPGLDQRLAVLDDDLDTTLRASPVWRAARGTAAECAGDGPRVCPAPRARAAGVGQREASVPRRLHGRGAL